MKWFTPTYFEKSIYGISFKMLKQKDIRLLILDIDNTLVPTSAPLPTDEINSWLFKAAAEGFEVCFISNNSKKRVETFAGGIYYTVHKARKPLTYGIKKALKRFRLRPRNACLIGDQLFTDILCANRAKIMSILVEPVSDDESGFIRFKRKIEKRILSAIKPAQFALVGNPVLHSKSPVIHNKLFKDNGINGEYKLYETTAEELATLVDYFKYSGYTGFNVTVPFKIEILKYINHLSASAMEIGSVNTVHIKDGKLYGYNTDGDGFVMMLEANNTKIKGAHVKIIGAGGTTPSIAMSLLNNGASSIKIYNRTLSNSLRISRMNSAISAYPLVEFSARDCDILINTTSVGLDSYECPVDNIDDISPNTVVYDIIYSPPTTTFMQKALDKGLKAYNGYDMLVNQAALAQGIWFK